MTTAEFGEKDLIANMESAFRPGGFMEAAAQAALEQPTELAPNEVADVIVPPKPAGESLPPRWQLATDAKNGIKEVADRNEEPIVAMAEQIGMRHNEAVSDVDIVRIYPDAAVWTVEGGANRTSVVRRTLAIEAMQKVYGEEAANYQLFQFGGNREIPRTRNDKPNAEYSVAQEIAGDFLPEDDSLTEFDLNVASARQGGWEVTSDEQENVAAQRVVRLQKEGSPELVLVYPHKTEKGGLEDGFSAVAALTGSLTGKQLVIATNGQYRPKDETQAEEWAKAHDTDMLPPVAIGDEPGYKVVHAGREITTANRAAIIYVNEFAVLHRLLTT